MAINTHRRLMVFSGKTSLPFIVANFDQNSNTNMATSTPVLTVGPIPFEAIGGSPFDDGKYTGIRSMTIRHGDVVVSIRTEYDNNGQSVWSAQHGTGSGVVINRTDEIKLDYPDEFLVSVSGTSTPEFPTQNLVVRTLTIQSNKKTYGPYGRARAGAQSFSTASTGCKIIGFHGRSGVALDAIGTYLVPKDQISVGPFGGTGGETFNDGTWPAIRQLVLRHGEGFVSMQTVYENKNGQNQWSAVHGHIAGGTTSDVNLASDEYLISISGYYTEGSDPVVQSLKFQSNKNSYGPYGTAQGIPFSTSTTAGTGKIVGFHGKSGEYINSIAAYFDPLA